MRDHKFRVWDEINKEMMFVLGISYYDNGKISNVFGKNSKGEIITCFKNFKLIEYADKQDKDKKDVFEGDILELKYGGIIVVHFKNGCFCLYSPTQKREAFFVDECLKEFPSENMKVIGNILADPELLGKGGILHFSRSIRSIN